MDDIQTNVLKVFLLVIHSHLFYFAGDLYFFKLTQPLTVSVKEKGGKPDRKPCPLPYGLGNPYRNLKSENSHSRLCPEIPQGGCTMHNHEFGFWIRNLSKVGSRSGIKASDPQHCPSAHFWIFIKKLINRKSMKKPGN